MKIAYTRIPTYNVQTKEWTETNFESQEEFAAYLDTLWNDECDYEFDETSFEFNKEGRKFVKNKCYIDAQWNSPDHRAYFKKEKEKCRRGVIYINRNKQWYITREYYMCINFLPVSNKEQNYIDTFLEVRDVQYHMALYEKRAEAHHKHAVILKKRQCASSLFHCAKTLNAIWFERNAVCKIFASDKTYLEGDNGIWKFYSKYRDHLNTHTGWIRAFSPDRELSWTQRKEINVDGNKQYTGLSSVLVGITLQKSATTGVGGASYYGFHEEFGIAPKGDDTYNFFTPAVSSGKYTTGMFIGAGSVGDLSQCRPLEKYIYEPRANGFMHTMSTWVDKERQPTEVGCYIPEHWGMPGFLDEYGNSDKMAAFDYLNDLYISLKNNPKVDPKDYQITLSQKPIYLKDAFKYREISEFPVDKLEAQQNRIELKDKENKWNFKPIKCILKEGDDGKIKMITHNLPEEHKYPIVKSMEDKRGVVTIYEMPDVENPPMFRYFGGVDTVEADYTKSSDSVATCDIVVKGRRVLYKNEETGKVETRIEGDKLVATYRGMYNTNDKTNDQIWLLVKMYNAFTLVERNKPNFINDMKRMGRERYLAKESDLSIFKDLNINHAFSGSSPYGFHKGNEDSALWKYMKETGKEYLLREYGYVYKKDSEEVLRPLRGIDRIDDFWLIEELINYSPDKNTDRIISFFAALTLAKQFEIERGIETVNEVKDAPLVQRRTRESSYSMLGGFSQKPNIKINKPPKSLI